MCLLKLVQLKYYPSTFHGLLYEIDHSMQSRVTVFMSLSDEANSSDHCCSQGLLCLLESSSPVSSFHAVRILLVHLPPPALIDAEALHLACIGDNCV